MSKNHIEFDLRGQICPSCLLMSLKEVNTHQVQLREQNTQLHILTDDRQATNTIPEAVKRMGYQVDVEKVNNSYCIKIYQG